MIRKGHKVSCPQHINYLYWVSQRAGGILDLGRMECNCMQDTIDIYNKINEKGKLLYIQHKNIGDIGVLVGDIPYPTFPYISIEFPYEFKSAVEQALTAYKLVAEKLGIKIYEVDGKSIFPVMGKDGKLTGKVVVYLYMINEGE